MTSADVFYAALCALPPQPRLPTELGEYTDALYNFHGAVYSGLGEGPPLLRLTPEAVAPCDTRALLACSGGLDSVAALAWALRTGLDVHAVFVSKLNRTVNHRELPAFHAVCAALGLPEERMHVLTGVPNVKRTAAVRVPVDGKLKECAGKNQYVLWRMLPLARELGAGAVMFGDDFEDAMHASDHFSDTRQSFELFMPVAVAVLGRPLLHKALPGSLYSKRARIEYLWQHAPEVLPLTASCYQSARNFRRMVIANKMSPNMCGKCFKCLRNLALFKELKLSWDDGREPPAFVRDDTQRL